MEMGAGLVSPANAYILHIPLVVFSIFIPVTGITFFSYIIYRRILPLRAASEDPRWNSIGERLIKMLKFGFGQYRQPKYPLAGALHIIIFFGFLTLSIRSFSLVAIGIWEDFTFPGLDGKPGYVYTVFKDNVALVTLVACVIAMIRRGVFKPVRYAVPPELGKGHPKEALLILGLISALLLADIFFEASLISANRIKNFPGPATWIVAHLLTGTSLGILQKIHVISYFFHDLIFFIFLCLLPLGKHFHVITSLPNIFFMKLNRGSVKPIKWNLLDKQLDELESFGVTKLEDFTWKHTLDFYTCADCGRCSDQCPATAAQTPLSPRFISIKCRDYCYGRYPILGRAEKSIPLVGTVFSAEEIWSCTTCGACEAECPLFIEYLDKIIDLRRGLLDEGNVPEGIQEALEYISEEGNSFAESEDKRADWCRELSFPIKNIFQEKAENLWFVGDFASFDVRAAVVSRVFAKILKELTVDYALAYEAEKNSGNDIRRIGEEGLFEELRESNMEFLNSERFKNIITTDPHSFNALKMDYQEHNKNIQHYSEFLLDQIKKGDFKFAKQLDYNVTYHDSCYLGRYHGLYEAPRKLLQMTGVKQVEMTKNKNRSFCCGGGGGGIWIGERENIQKINALRVQQALELDIDVLVVSCPKCLVMFEDALKSMPNSKGLVVKDLLELVWEAIDPEKSL
jgi:Fe-S oxidoreductase